MDSLFIGWNFLACRLQIVGSKAKCMMCFFFFFQSIESPHFQMAYFAHSLFVHWIFATLEGLGGGLQILFELLKQRNNVWDLTSKPLGDRHNYLCS